MDARAGNNGWMEAMKLEHSKLMERGTWKYIRLDEVPPGTTILRSVWSFKNKLGKEGQLTQQKARGCVDGGRQKYGVDYWESYAPTANAAHVRMLLALAAQENWTIHQNDIDSAFLYGRVPSNVILVMRCLQGFEVYDTDGHPMVCLLILGLYGLVQAALLWNERLVEWFKTQGFQQCEKDACIFRKITAESKVIVPVHVDDLIPMGYPPRAIESWEDALEKEFSIKRLGNADWYSGVRIERGDGWLQLSQEGYWTKMLDQHNMADAYIKRMPLPAGTDLVAISHNPDDPEYDPERADGTTVRSLIGGYSWPAEMTRPDLSFARAHGARLQQDCSMTAYNTLLNVLRYARGTMSHGVTYFANTKLPNKPIFFVDTDFAGCRTTRKSTYFVLGIINGGAYFWKTKLMPGRPADSTEEAEFRGLLHAARQAVCDRHMLSEIGFPVNEPTDIYCDNNNAVQLAVTGRITPSNKHIEMRGHVLRHLNNTAVIRINWIDTKSNLADIGTKAMRDPAGFELLRDILVKPRPAVDSV